MLDAFLAGFTGSLYDQRTKEEERIRKQEEDKLAFNRRMEEALMKSDMERQSRTDERATIAGEQVVARWVDGDREFTEFANGKVTTRTMSEGEYAQFLDANVAKLAETERGSLLANLGVDEKLAKIEASRAGAEASRARAAEDRADAGRSPDEPKIPVPTHKAAMMALGLGEFDDLPSDAHREVVLELLSGGLRLTEAAEYLKVVQRRHAAANQPPP